MSCYRVRGMGSFMLTKSRAALTHKQHTHAELKQVNETQESVSWGFQHAKDSLGVFCTKYWMLKRQSE